MLIITRSNTHTHTHTHTQTHTHTYAHAHTYTHTHTHTMKKKGVVGDGEGGSEGTEIRVVLAMGCQIVYRVYLHVRTIRLLGVTNRVGVTCRVGRTSNSTQLSPG